MTSSCDARSEPGFNFAAQQFLAEEFVAPRGIAHPSSLSVSRQFRRIGGTRSWCRRLTSFDYLKYLVQNPGIIIGPRQRSSSSEMATERRRKTRGPGISAPHETLNRLGFYT